VVDSRPDANGLCYIRWRYCTGCRQLFQTAEQATGQRIPLREPLKPTQTTRTAKLFTRAETGGTISTRRPSGGATDERAADPDRRRRDDQIDAPATAAGPTPTFGAAPRRRRRVVKRAE